MTAITFESAGGFVQRVEYKCPSAISKIRSVAEKILPGPLRRGLAHNFGRDAGWTGASVANLTLGQTVAPLDVTQPLQQQVTSSAFVAPTMAQWVIASGIMVVAAIVETIYHKVKGHELSAQQLAQIWAPVAAASCAIPMWDLGQTIGAKVAATAFKGSALAIGLISAPFTGIFEGFTQWFVQFLFDFATNPEARQKWKENPSLMTKLFIKEFLLNTTIGAIPGTVWQLVYFLALPTFTAAYGPVGGAILLSALVASAVMIANFSCAHGISQVSQAIDKTLGWDEELKKLHAQIQRTLTEALLVA